MDLSVVFLGTGARGPTPERGTSAAVVLRGPERILVDCGEGAQLQLMRSVAGLRRLTAILITHGHGDHVLGLPGLLATFSDAREEPLTVLGPEGTRALVEGFRPFFGELRFPLRVREMAAGEAEPRDGYALRALPARHGPAALGWVLEEDGRPGRMDPERARRAGVGQGRDRARLARGEVVRAGGARVAPADVLGPPRPGRRVAFSGDTLPAAALARAVRGADLLVHEATFLERDAALARRTGHSTAAEAARLAASAGVRALALTHRSQRYAPEAVLAEARAVFPGALVPADLDAIVVPLPERGPPRLVPGGGRAPAAGASRGRRR